MNYKYIVAMLLSVVFIFISTIVVGAQNKNAEIYASSISQLDEDETLVELSIKNNPGIMGFKITLDYSPDDIEIISSTKGQVTASGNYSDNIGVADDECDILWYDTSQVVGDGTISLIKCKLLTEEAFTVKLSISQEDTFDENWNDVDVSCQNISFNSDDGADNKNGNTTETTVKISGSGTDDVDSSFIITDILNKNGIEDLEDIDVKVSSDILNSANKQMSQITEQENYYRDFDDLVSDYQDDLYRNFVLELDSLDTDDSIGNLIDKFKNDNDKKNIEESDVEGLMEDFEALGLSDVYSKYLSEKQLLKGINQAYETEQKIIKNQGRTDFVLIWIISMSVVAVVLITGTLLLIKKRGVYKNES